MKVYWVKISLRDVSPMIWRRLRIPGETSLAMLHDIIGAINAWKNFHLHQFHNLWQGLSVLRHKNSPWAGAQKPH